MATLPSRIALLHPSSPPLPVSVLAFPPDVLRLIDVLARIERRLGAHTAYLVLSAAALSAAALSAAALSETAPPPRPAPAHAPSTPTRVA